jgi:hypothetical protein
MLIIPGLISLYDLGPLIYPKYDQQPQNNCKAIKSNITLLVSQLATEIYSSLKVSKANGVSRTTLNSLFSFI